jgi:hypothetical protein
MSEYFRDDLRSEMRADGTSWLQRLLQISMTDATSLWRKINDILGMHAFVIDRDRLIEDIWCARALTVVIFDSKSLIYREITKQLDHKLGKMRLRLGVDILTLISLQ